MGFLFTSESVSEGHPDKVSDQISDAILDEFLRHDATSKVACETLCTTGLVVVAGEVRSEAYVDVQGVARRVIKKIGYTKSEYQFDCNSCGILSAIHEQSADINQGVAREKEEEQGAGDQGIMFGYACNETRELMPATLILSHVILKELADIRREGKVMTYLRPDSKSQVTIEYDEATRKPLRVHTIVVSTQHDEFILPSATLTEKEAEQQMQQQIREDVRTMLREVLTHMVSEGTPPDVITFAGNGEPTMHPDFEGVIDDTLALRDELCPSAKVSVLSNATQIHREDVRRALMRVDNNILKLDSAFDFTVQLVNKPQGSYSVARTVELLKMFEGNLIIQTMFLRGEYAGQKIDNTTDEEVKAWLKLVAEIAPRQVMVYSLDRDTPCQTLEKIEKQELNAIAERVRALGIECSVA